MLEKVWAFVENSESDTTKAEILAVTYFNSPSNYLKDIQADFDKWTIDDFESALESVLDMPTIEGASYPETMFGVVNYTCSIPYNEGSAMSDLHTCVWDASKPVKKKFF